MEVSEIFLNKFLGEDIYNLLIYRELLKNNGSVMHQLPDVVHVYLNMFAPLPGNCSGTQVTPKRLNTLSNHFTQIDHRSTHRCLSRVYNPREGNSPRPQPNSYLEKFIM